MIQITKILTRIKNYIKNDPFILVITLFFIAFTIYWSYISIMKFFALQASVYDLGIAMENAWLFIYNPLYLLPNQALFYIPNGILLVIFPIFLLKNFPLILAFQAAFITFGIFPLYGISKNLLKNGTAAFFIALSYLFYPLLNGNYWFDFHYQALFPTLFFIGYYFYIKSKYKYSVLFLILAGLTTYPYIEFILLFSIIILIENIFNFKFSKNNYNSKNLKFAILILILSLLIIFIYNYNSFFNIEHLYGGLTGNAHFNQNNNNPFYQIDNKIFTLLLLFLPFLGLPLLSKRFIILYFPFIYVLFYSNYLSYEFPFIFHYQYGPLIFPFLYLGTIDSLSHLFKKYDKTKSSEKTHIKIKAIISNPKVKISATILILVILLVNVYQPYAPLNKYSMTDYDVSQNTAVNWTTFNNLMHIVNMIPENDPYVLNQNNIPELYPKPPVFFQPSTPFLLNWILNLNNNLTLNNNYIKVGNHNYKLRVDYILADLNSGWFYPGSESMYNFTKLFYGSGEYGILAEASGIVLLKKNYTGPIIYYVPLYENFPYSQLILGPLTKENNNYLYAQNISKFNTIWYGPYKGLPPGEYNITFQLMTSNNNANNTLMVDVSANYGQTILASKTINGSYFNNKNKWENITLKVNLTNFYGYVEFRGFSSYWNGTIALKGVYVEQVAPPSRSKEFNDLKYMMSLIPQNSTVIADKNLPDPIPEILTDYHVIQASQINITKPDYGIAGYPSSWSTELYGSGEYGILAEASGIVLLKKNLYFFKRDEMLRG